MKCMIPGQNVKILARALHSLARVGDDLFVDPLDEGLVLRSVNSSQSAFAEFVFNHSFFSSYSVDGGSPEFFPKCKISMKSCLAVFKSSHSMDKMVDWCQLRLASEAVQLVFKVKYTGGSTKTYFLPVIESETLQVKYKPSETIKLVATSKMLSGIVKNFRANEDEITVAVTRQKATFRNHIDTSTDKNKTVRTELGVLAGEFEMFSVNEPVSLTFCLKQLRAVVAFAESTGLPVNLYLEVPGRPVILSVNNESLYEVNFVVSTLATIQESQSQRSQKSDLPFVSNAQKQQLRAGKKKEVNQPEVNAIQSKSVPSCSNNDKNLINEVTDKNKFMNNNGTIGYSGSGSESRKRQRDPDEPLSEISQIHKSNTNSKNNVTKCGSSSNSSIYKSVACVSSTQDTVLISNNEMECDPVVFSSPQGSPKNIFNNVFNRCFNATFQRSELPGFNNVIAYDSDGLEDSD